MNAARVLVVDDNEENIYLLRALLEGHGYEAVSAANGADALDKARQNPPDLIIADILMPVMDGFALCREWKRDAQLKSIPFIFYTATYTDDRDRKFALSLGAERFILKPQEPDAFMAIIQEVLQQASSPNVVQAKPEAEMVAPEEDESGFLMQYNEALIRKLEDKMEQLERVNRELERDIAKRKQVEEELLLKNALLEAQSDTSIDGIVAIDSNGAIILHNKRFSEMWDIPPDVMATRRGQDVLACIVGQLRMPQEALDKFKYLSARPLEESRDEIELTDGRFFELYTAPLVLGDGTSAGRLWDFRDVTEHKRAEKQLKESADKLRQMINGIIKAATSTVESRDPYTAGHQRRVAQLARAIAAEMGLTPDQIEGVYMAAYMHDLGKIATPAEILSKPGKLNALEFGIIKGHPQCGYDILKEIDFPWPVAHAIHQHHERLDGSGYPQGLAGDDIIIEARIIAVADVVEAMSTHRPYRAAFNIEKALEEIERKKSVCYDPRAVDACVKLFKENRFKFE